MGLRDELGLAPGVAAEGSLRRELENDREHFGLRPGYLYKGTGDFLLQHGHFYSGRPIPEQYEHLMGTPGDCFTNAFLACEEEPSLRYCEGLYTLGMGHFMGHAWCLDPDGGLVEVTFPTKNYERFHDSITKMKFPPPDRYSYWGAIFRPELIRWHADRHLCAPILARTVADATGGTEKGLDMTQNHDFPILKVPYDPERTSL